MTSIVGCGSARHPGPLKSVTGRDPQDPGVDGGQAGAKRSAGLEYGQATPTPPAVTATTGTKTAASTPAAVPLDLTDFKRDLSELTDRLGQAQDCL
jgi:hypothetical protein